MIPGLFKAKNVFDLGSNAGRVSCQLVFEFGAASVTGVDIDPGLVRQAESLLALRSSRVLPASEPSHAVVDYFPMSAVLTHGYRFEPQDNASRHLTDWPAVRFISEDWATSENPTTSGPYDVILALSVIKWIHLEHLDHGLLKFFHKCALSLLPGGYLVIELQDWSSYEKAVRCSTAPHFREAFAALKLRPETSFSEILQQHGLNLCATSDTLPRRINIYRKE
ncbi:Bicoid-interacting protein 3-domain-containing protein [Dendryphion nanum]|uniref:RNA methyltransferase n=1 Tax=Dendryphion nanum TaxID=256645 RepID=A0A9P9DCC0_9PLEO|nr:Bicoid-interacting protein 3-domain-containing protein [Dendryphion nanum]